MNPKDLIKQYLGQRNVMQLATSVNDQPYVCNVHFYADDQLNLYWISTEARRHSQELAQNPKVSAAILIHENTPAENYVIGLTIIGTVEFLGKTVDSEIAAGYINKLQKEPSLIEEIASGQNPHRFYRLTPSSFVLFDSKNFPQDPRQEVPL